MRAAFSNSKRMVYAAVLWVGSAPVLIAQQTPASTPQTTPQTPTRLPIPAASTPQVQTPTPPAPSQQQNLAQSMATTHVQLASASAAPPPPPPGTLVDQVIAVVNGDLVMESDVDEERRFEAFQPLGAPGGFSREQAIDRLVDRDLILQQARLQPDDAVSMDAVKAELDKVRKDIPACQQYHCETEAGWTKFVEAQGFTVPELEAEWRQRMEVLKFVEIRFRSGIRIAPSEIKTYYEQTLLPQYRRQDAKAPPLDAISDRIQEILLQRQVGDLLTDWLQSLKAEGTVRFMKPGEVAP
jgi:hypothetical protein